MRSARRRMREARSLAEVERIETARWENQRRMDALRARFTAPCPDCETMKVAAASSTGEADDE